MTLNFYTISDDSRVVNKTLGNIIHSCSASVYEDCSMVRPSFLVDYSPSVVLSNYIEAIAYNGQNIAWKRFYYIEDYILMPGGRMIARCVEDVLMSYKDEIMSLRCNIIRQEFLKTPYIIDRCMQQEVRSFVETVRCTNSPFKIPGSGDYSYVMTVIGGYTAQVEGS